MALYLSFLKDFVLHLGHCSVPRVSKQNPVYWVSWVLVDLSGMENDNDNKWIVAKAFLMKVPKPTQKKILTKPLILFAEHPKQY